MIRNVLIGVILAFVVVFLILLIVYTARLNKETYKMATTTSKQMPPWNYFKRVASQCPDYWDNLGEDESSEDIICRNSLNVPINNSENSTNCYDDANEKVKKFKKLNFTGDNISLNNGKKVLNNSGVDSAVGERCTFVKNCGPTQMENAAWIGFDNGVNGYANCE